MYCIRKNMYKTPNSYRRNLKQIFNCFKEKAKAKTDRQIPEEMDIIDNSQKIITDCGPGASR